MDLYATTGTRVKYAFLTSGLIFLILSLLLYLNISKARLHEDVDSKAYLERGTLFAATNSFVHQGESTQPYYALGYALIIGLLYKLFGQSKEIIIILQVLLSLFSCLLIMSIARRIFGNHAHWYAGLLFAVNVGYLVFTQFILTEIVLAFFLVLFFDRLTCFLQQERDGKINILTLLQSALALGISILVKPAALYFVWVVGVLLLMVLKESLGMRLRSAVLFIVFFFIPVLGYMSYNHYAFANFCVSKLAQVNLYYWYFPNVLALESGTTSDEERLRLLALSKGKHDFNVVLPLFWQKLKQKPYLFAQVWFVNVAKTLVGLYTTNLKVLVEPQVHGGAISYFKMSGNVWQKALRYITAGATQQWVVVVGLFEVVYSLVRYVLAIFGICFLLKKRQWHWLLLSLAFIAYFSLITGHDGCARFRMMFECMLIILAAGGITQIKKILCLE